MHRGYLAGMAVIGGLAAAALGGCSSPLPIAEGYPIERQKVMQSTAHWRILAADLSEQIRQRQALDPALKDKPIYVQRQQAQTPFNTAFHEFLVAELLNKGVKQTLVPPARPQDAMVLKYTTQVVHYDSERQNRPAPGVITGSSALLAIPLAGVGSLPDFGKSQTLTGLQAGGLVLGEGVVADILAGEWATEGTATELLVTTAIYDGASMWFRQTDGFYIGDKDYAHYEPAQPAAKVIVY